MDIKNLADVPGINKVIPQEFVWHVSLRENRDSILKFGLRPDKSEHNCIFANNQSKKIKLFYPFCLEIYFGAYSNDILHAYDYWRINTARVEGDWYIDPNMSNIPLGFPANACDYVVTESPIPSAAIKLYCVSERFSDKRFSVIVSGEELINGRSITHYLRGEKNEDIKKEIAELRKEINVTSIRTIRHDAADDEFFPLEAIML